MAPEVGPLLIVTLLAMLVGLVGSVLPGLPGVTLIFLSAVVYAFLTDFAFVGVPIVLLLFLFAALAFVADFFATSYGARRFGASNWGTVGGAVGGLVGTLFGLLLAGVGSIFGLIFGTIGGMALHNGLDFAAKVRRHWRTRGGAAMRDMGFATAEAPHSQT